MGTAGAQTTAPPPPKSVADLTLTVNGKAMSGWHDVRVTRSIERCPNDFDIQMTDLFPGQAQAMVMQPGDACSVSLVGAKVITGYVDKLLPSYDDGQHSIRVTGRGRCQDLVDASAEWPGGQIKNSTVLQIAQKLAGPYGITVSAPGVTLTDASGHPLLIEQFNLMLGETAYEIIERVCRAANLLCYEDENGNLVLAHAGNGAMASGFVEGVNVLAARAEFTADERFSEYDCFLMAMDTLMDIGEGGNLLATATDVGIKRHRKHYIIADAGAGGMQLAQARATWEANRRWGRGNTVIMTGDDWRDSAGVLRTPNKTAPVTAPNIKWTLKDAPLIGTVSYLFDGDRGTRAEVTLAPPQAYQPEPILLQPDWGADLTP